MGWTFHRPIVTRRDWVPWRWVILINLPWFGVIYNELIGQMALTYTMKKFTENPALIAFLGSINIAFNFMVGAVANYMSDRIWTRWGRRRPFLIVGWLGVAATLTAIPLMPNLPSLVAMIVLYQFFLDVATPLEPLCMEVVPPEQRGRAQSIRMVFQTFSTLYFLQIMFAHFDRERLIEWGGWSWMLTGEQTTYWAGAGFMLMMAILLMFQVREAEPEEHGLAAHFDLRTFLRDLFGHGQWWMIYLLFVAPTVLNAVWGQFQPLLVTEQFGFSKGSLAWMSLPGTLLQMILVMPVLGWFADRVPRIAPVWPAVVGLASAAAVLALYPIAAPAARAELPPTAWMFGLSALTLAASVAAVIGLTPILSRWIPDGGPRLPMFLIAMAGGTVMALIQWILIKWVYAEGPPPITIIFLVSQVNAVIASSGWVVMGPMLFDFIPSDRMGTVSSGMGFVNGVVKFVMINVGGLWVTYISLWTLPAGRFDYASCFVLQTLFGLVATGAVILFIRRLRAGRIVEYGKIEARERENGAAPPHHAAA